MPIRRLCALACQLRFVGWCRCQHTHKGKLSIQVKWDKRAVPQKVVPGYNHVRIRVQGQALGGSLHNSEVDISSLRPYLSYNLTRIIRKLYHC
jgi:hypothetical protein